MHVNEGEAEAILPLVQALFEPLVARYDETRYQPKAYTDLLEAFADPININQEHIELALRWKYARPKPRPLPQGHIFTIQRLTNRWPIAMEATDNAERIDALIDPECPACDFVSRAFVVHLIDPNNLPIIDRFNHRAVRWFLGCVREDFPLGGLPNSFEDIQLVQCFLHQVTVAWGKGSPDVATMDRYLMMFGKNVAPRYGGKAVATGDASTSSQ